MDEQDQEVCEGCSYMAYAAAIDQHISKQKVKEAIEKCWKNIASKEKLLKELGLE